MKKVLFPNAMLERSKGCLFWAVAVLVGVIVLLANCSSTHHPSAPLSAAPAAPNESSVMAEVLEASVVDSLSLNILPQQPIVVLKLKLLSVKPVGSLPSFLDGKSGETITAYSKDRTVVNLTNKSVVATVSFQGDERGGSFWVQKISWQSSK